MSGTVSQTGIPGYVAGTWTIDPVHSDVGFVVRHMMLTKVRGRFARFAGEIVTAADPLDSSVAATIELASIDTGDEQRDAHLRSADFFETDTYPTMTYRSTGVRPDGADFIIDGELTLKGVTRPVPLRVEYGRMGSDAFGGTRAGCSVTAEINRLDFGVSFNPMLETGGFVVGDKVGIQLEIQAVLKV